MVDYGGYESKIATLGNGHSKWLKRKAKRVDVNNSSEIKLVEELSDLMFLYIENEGLAGTCSNEIIWDRTKYPMSVIQVPNHKSEYLMDFKNPKKENYMTLVNPRIERSDSDTFIFPEECISLHDGPHNVERYASIILYAHILENSVLRPIELEYRVERFSIDRARFYSALVQHEVDHLNGKLIN